MANSDENYWWGRGRQFTVILLLLIALPIWSQADEVHLKDGQRLTSPRAWVEGDYAHFILQGTSDVEIRYDLEIVDRILTAEGKQIYPAGAAPAETITVEPAEVQTPTPVPVPTPPKSVQAPKAKKIPEASSAPPALVDIDTKLLRARAKKLREVPFYDPRRKQKYWAASQSRHNDLNSAVAALAELFKRPTGWVTAHMGNTNDLSQIHLNLIRQLENWNQPQPPSTGNVTANKATPKKVPAKAAPIAEGPKKSGAKSAETSPKAVRASNPFATNLPDTQGPLFYSPRRPKKFWANETSRHDSLSAAINALAEQYGQPVEWIEAHMGESNSLQGIHRNLTEAAQKEKE